MEVIETTEIDITELEKFFTECFKTLTGSDNEVTEGDGDGDENQDFREWFGIDYLQDYLKYSHVILATENNKIIGGAIVGMQHPLSWPDGKKYELFILGVLPEYRKKGIGKIVVEKVEEISKFSGASSIILNTHEQMPETQRFYTNLGYVQLGVLENYYANGNAVFLSKQL